MANGDPLHVEQYLADRGVKYTSLEKLKGGTANFVYRFHSPSSHPSTKILKHAEPYVAGAPSIPFPVVRMDYEHRALTTIPDLLPAGDFIKLPEVYSYDADKHVLTTNDGGPRTLKEVYSDPDVDVEHYGRRLGEWLAALHSHTKDTDLGGDTITARTIYRFAYNHLSTSLQEYGLDPALGERINADYGALLATDDQCICHGDFWPGNVLVRESSDGLTIVDWEMTRRGCGATDVGQFAAEAYLLDHFRGERGLREAFLKGYRTAMEVDLEKEFVKRVAVHMGVHLAFWPTRVDWGTKEETREVVMVGDGLLRGATGRDWEDCIKSSLIRDIL